MSKGEFENYTQIIKHIDELIDFLNSIQIDPESKSHLENDYLRAHEFFENYKNSPSNVTNADGRGALGGLYELYKWVWSVKESEEFNKLTPHLNLLLQASPRINAQTPLLNPVTNKQDDKTNKFIEAIIGFFTVAHGKNVDLDDPVYSSGGDNPDIIFTYQEQIISIACKTLRSKNPSTIFQNIESAAKQISRANCDDGYIVLNFMNIIDHGKIQEKIFTTVAEPFNIIKDEINELYASVLSTCKDELATLFSENTKTCPIVISIIHSHTKLNSPIGIISTSLKGTLITNLKDPDTYPEHQLELPRDLNNFIHNI
ncbi:hypothetical protein HP563_14225 [Pantoea dispersa]|uniref:hypothetical protein n=1 Tax=Pantoea dispersa TaxID=59814 RepID=UPI00352863BF